MLSSLTRPAVIVDFQAILAALLLLERDTNTGRYPERTPEVNRLLPLVEFTRRNVIRRAQEAELYTVVTNSDGSPQRRRELIGLLGTGGAEEVIDPGLEVVTRRLSVDGRLSPQCEQAVNRWYGRLNRE